MADGLDAGLHAGPVLAAAAGPPPLELHVAHDGLALVDQALGNAGPVRIDCAELDRACRSPDRDQPLARAVGLRRGPAPTVYDATAGLLGDSVLLAALGCRVTAVERSAVIAAMITDALARAAAHPALDAALRDRFAFRHADAREALREAAAGPEADRPDVVYLDPMHPPRRKSALVKKDMRAVRAVVGEDPDAAELFLAAAAAARRRVVLKHPRHAPALIPGRTPLAVHVGRAVRYEVYAPDRR